MQLASPDRTMQRFPQSKAYTWLPSPISSVDSSSPGAPVHNPFPQDDGDIRTSAEIRAGWPTATLKYETGSITIGPIPADTPPQSALAQRRRKKSQEGIKTSANELKVPERKEGETVTTATTTSSSKHGHHHHHKSKEQRAQWEPVSPGIQDRSPEVVATIKRKEYYWPSSDELKARGSATAAASSTAAALSSSTSSSVVAADHTIAAGTGAGSRRGSKAATYNFPVHGLEGGLLEISNAEFRGLLQSALKSNDLATTRRLITSPLPQSAGTIKCFLKRNKSGLIHTFFPSYECFLEETDRPCFMMSAKKRTKNKTSNYTISLLHSDMLAKSKAEASVTSEDPNYLGKLRSNFTGSEFVGYDAGINPKTFVANSGHTGSSGPTGFFSGRRASETKLSNVRQELCAMIYENNVLSRCPRSFTCILPGMLVEDPSQSIIARPLVPSDTLLYQYKQLVASQAEEHPNLHEDQVLNKEILVLKNKEPVWEQSIQAFCLNFHGRATIASVKNFQLINAKGDKNKNPVLLQFGKMDKDIFTMDVAYPLSLLQAFEISLSGLDTKMVCD